MKQKAKGSSFLYAPLTEVWMYCVLSIGIKPKTIEIRGELIKKNGYFGSRLGTLRV
jgi:hypothetical protein